MTLPSFGQRFEYLGLDGVVGEQTFGRDRPLNQEFYHSAEWRNLRHHVIDRDRGCDLGVRGYDIFHRPIIHHMNPMMPEDILHGNVAIMDPEFLILTTHRTHNAIHYGQSLEFVDPLTERQPGDTKLW